MSKPFSLLPRIASCLFITSTVLFISLHPKSILSLDALNVLQYNELHVDYSFVPAPFAYEIPGLVLAIYFIEKIRNPAGWPKTASYLLLAGSLILIQLGSLTGSTEKRDADKMIYLVLLTWLFPLVHALAFLILAYKIRRISTKHLLVNLLTAIYIFYAIPLQLLITGETDLKVTISIVMCFLWYFSLPSLLDEVGVRS